MGIRNFWKLLKPAAEFPKDSSICVDASILILSLQRLPKENAIYIFFKKLLKHFFSNNRLIFVFDGRKIPKQKQRTFERRKFERLKGEFLKSLKRGDGRKQNRPVSALNKEEKKNLEKEMNVKWGGEQSEGLIQRMNVDFRNIDNASDLADRLRFSSDQVLNIIERGKRRRKILDLQKNLIKSDSSKKYYLLEGKATQNGLQQNVNESIVNLKSSKDKEFMEELDRIFGSDSEATSPVDSLRNSNSYSILRKSDVSINIKGKNFPDTPSGETERDPRGHYSSFFDANLNDESSKEFYIENTEESEFESSTNNFYESSTNNFYEKDNHINGALVDNEDKSNRTNNTAAIPNDGNDAEKKPINDTTFLAENISNPLDFLEYHQDFTDTVKHILDKLEIPFVESLYEADSQCGYLCEKGLVDIVESEDSDMFLFGSKKVLRRGEVYELKNIKNEYMRLFVNNKTKELDDFGECFLSRENLIKLSILLGSDYSVGKKYFGLKTSIKSLFTYEFDNLELNEIKEVYCNPKILKEEELICSVKNFKEFKYKTKRVNFRKGVEIASSVLKGRERREIVSCFNILIEKEKYF